MKHPIKSNVSLVRTLGLMNNILIAIISGPKKLNKGCNFMSLTLRAKSPNKPGNFPFLVGKPNTTLSGLTNL